MISDIEPLRIYLISFLITFVSEMLILLCFKPFRTWRGVMICFFANLFTHPIYRFFRLSLFGPAWTTGMLFLEPAVIVIETFIYALVLPVKWRRAFVFSLLANLLSLSIGLLSRYLRA